MSDKTALGDRMKGYERVEAGRRAMPLLPIMIRLDGKSFSRWTSGLERPYDKRLSDLMVRVTALLVDYIGATVGYTQSDEISLVLYSNDLKRENMFAGKFQKLTSILAAYASVEFNRMVDDAIPEKAGATALFDCRAWQVPTVWEAVNTILWRERDATKNSISMAASHYYSHSELIGKTGNDRLDMLMAKGINWNDYPAFFKRGQFVQSCVESKPFSADELSKLPDKHEARSNPDLLVERRVIVFPEAPPFNKIINRSDFLLYGSEPITSTDQH